MNRHEVCFALIYDKKNSRYTAHVLTAAVETFAKDVYLHLVPIGREPWHELQNIALLRDRCRKIVVGVTFNTMQMDMVLKIVPEVRKLLPEALLVAGGPHASGDPYGTLTKLKFDVVVYGEGEETLIELLSNLGSSEDFRVCGTAYLEGDRLVVRKRFPIDLNRYPPFPFWRNMFNPIEIMRGCSAACYFCQITYMFGLPRYRNEECIEFYSRIMLERGLKDLRFIAPNSFGYGSRDGIKPAADKLLSLLHRLRILADRNNGRIFFGTFPSEVRPDSVEEDLVREIRKLVDNKHIIIGIQSGSNKILERIHRRHSVEDAVNAVEILIRNGFQVDVDLILGFTFEDDEVFRETANLVSKLVGLGARLHLHTFLPLPGTPLFSHGFKPLREELKRYFTRLIGARKAYGYWLEQEKMAYRIEEYRKMGLIYDVGDYRDRLKICVC